MSPDTVSLLASDFSRRLRVGLGPQRFAELIAANRAETDPSVCNSHAFCDPNEFLAESFRAIVGRDFDPQSDADWDLGSAAWNIAKRSEFSL